MKMPSMSNTLDALAFQQQSGDAPAAAGGTSTGLGFSKANKLRQTVKKMVSSASFAGDDYSDAGTSVAGKSKAGKKSKRTGILKQSSEK